MRILLTGATGFIGRRLVPHLQSQHDLVVLSRKPHRGYELLGHNLQIIASLDEYPNLDSFDAIINLAGEPIANKRWSERQKRKISQSRWQLTEQLSQKSQAGTDSPAVVISGSAIGYYGHQTNDVIDETFEPSQHSFTHQVCQRWESLGLSMQSEQTRVCIIRTGVVLGREGGALMKMLPAYKWGVGGPMGSGEQYMSWIHIDDTVNAILFLLHNSQCQGIYNLTAPNPVTNKEFSHSLAYTLHRPDILKAPASLITLIFGELSELLLKGNRVIPAKLQQQGFDFKFIELKPALRELLHHDRHQFKSKLFY